MNRKTFLPGASVGPGGFMHGVGALVVVSLASLLNQHAVAEVHITHQYANTDAQSLIGMPMGNHKTIIDKRGGLRWSQWTLQHRGPEVPFGLSADLDGALDVELFTSSVHESPKPLTVVGQELYRGRFPFVATKYTSDRAHAEELAFAAQTSGIGLDVIQVTFVNDGSTDLALEVDMSGKRRNLPAFAEDHMLVIHDGHILALVEAPPGHFSRQNDGLVLTYTQIVKANSSTQLWIKVPYDMPHGRAASIGAVSAASLLNNTELFWKKFWAKGIQVELPEREIEDFFYSSIAYLFINTEYGPDGDLWTLDGPTLYRGWWPRSEYFMARAMDLTGYLNESSKTIRHVLRLQKDDGRWDGPILYAQTAWDGFGDEAGAIWDYYTFTQDKDFIERSYPYLLAAARWIHNSREETKLPPDIRVATKPFDRPLNQTCTTLPNPPLRPGDRPYWWGLLPWGFGDSGLPDGHAFAHNVMPLYGIDVAHRAAMALGKSTDANWLSREYDDYRLAIMTAIRRAVGLERDSPAYLPAMPVYPNAAVSQSFLAVFPAGLLPPRDPLVTGLLVRMEQTEIQGLPTNMGWLGRSGVWPGESFTVAETYLLRDEIPKMESLLLATLNHSYSTKVWKEEIRVDKTLPTACAPEPPSKEKIKGLVNQTGTGDQPEAWAHANFLILVRDMLMQEDGDTLHLLRGVPSEWAHVGARINARGAPTSFGGMVSYTFNRSAPNTMSLHVTLPEQVAQIIIHCPLSGDQSIKSARVNGRTVPTTSRATIAIPGHKRALYVEITTTN